MSAVEDNLVVLVPAIELRQIRRALHGMLTNHHRRGADGLRACKDGGAAYRLCFSEEEKVQILEHGKRRVDGAPAHSFLHEIPPFETYLDVLEALGNAVVIEALGEQA